MCLVMPFILPFHRSCVIKIVRVIKLETGKKSFNCGSFHHKIMHCKLENNIITAYGQVFVRR